MQIQVREMEMPSKGMAGKEMMESQKCSNFPPSHTIKEEKVTRNLEQMQEELVEEMQDASMDDIGSPIEDRDGSSSNSTGSLSDQLPHTLTHSYSSSHISPHSPTFKFQPHHHIHHHQQHLHHHHQQQHQQAHAHQGAFTHDEDRMQYASLEDRFPFLKDDRKRTRKLLSPEQTRILEAILERTIYPSTPLREAVARQLGIPPRKVQIWFQNKRQGRRRVPGSGEEMDPMNMTNDISMSNNLDEENEIDSEEKATSPTTPGGPHQNSVQTPVRENCLEHQSAADDMRLARLRDEYGRQFAELKIAPAFCDGDMYPAPHLGQFERYGGGDQTSATIDSSTLSSPTSAPHHETTHAEAATYGQRRHTISWQHHDAPFAHKPAPEMHNQHSWSESQMHHYRRAEMEQVSRDSHHHRSQYDSNDSHLLRPEYPERRGNFAYHHGSQRYPMQGYPSPVHHQAQPGTPLRAYHPRYTISHVDHPGDHPQIEQDPAYILRRRGMSNAPYPASLPLHRSYSNHSPYDRTNGHLQAEPMHRSFTSVSAVPYSPLGGPPAHHHPSHHQQHPSHWNTPRYFNGNGNGARYQMPPPPSPADLPPTPMSSRSYRSFFQDHRSPSNLSRNNLQEHSLISPRPIQSLNRNGGQSWNEKRMNGNGNVKNEMYEEHRNNNVKEENEVDDAYEKARKIDTMPLANKDQSLSDSGANKMTSLADVALRQKIRLAPLRIPSSTLAAFEKVKEIKEENKSNDGKHQDHHQERNEFQTSPNRIERRMSSNDLRVDIGKKRCSSMDLESMPPSPQSAKEVRMRSPTISPKSALAPINHAIELTTSSISPVVKVIVQERHDCLPSISEIMQN